MNKFSAFLSSAALVKLKDPVMTIAPSMIIILLWAMSWAESIFVGIPAFATNGKEFHPTHGLSAISRSFSSIWG